jgi:hypothetical protein
MNGRDPAHRRWYNDALSACAFFLLAFFLTRGAKNLLGPFGALFVFAITAGIGYVFARAAWHGLMGDRERLRLPKR